MIRLSALCTLIDRRRAMALAAVVSLLLVPAQAVTQPNATKGNAPSNTLQGFTQNRNQPLQIEAASLEVRDKEKKATFSGNVKVVQGDMTMRCKSMVVFYDGQPAGMQTVKAATPGPGGSQQISRLEATGGVTVVQKDQTATGDSALFDMKSNTVTLKGNVVVTQGQNIMRGDRLVVDLTTGVSRVDGSGPVKLMVQPGGSGDSKPGAGGSGGALGGLGGLGGLGSKSGSSR